MIQTVLNSISLICPGDVQVICPESQFYDCVGCLTDTNYTTQYSGLLTANLHLCATMWKTIQSKR